MDPCDGERVIELELALLTAEVRESRARLEALLDPEFREVGASGRWWARAEMIGALVAEATPATSPGGAGGGTARSVTGAPVPVEDVEARVVGPDLVLVSYLSDPDGRRARRTSLWRRSAGTWRLLHHQGTLAPDPT